MRKERAAGGLAIVEVALILLTFNAHLFAEQGGQQWYRFQV